MLICQRGHNPGYFITATADCSMPNTRCIGEAAIHLAPRQLNIKNVVVSTPYAPLPLWTECPLQEPLMPQPVFCLSVHVSSTAVAHRTQKLEAELQHVQQALTSCATPSHRLIPVELAEGSALLLSNHTCTPLTRTSLQPEIETTSRKDINRNRAL